MTKPFLRWVGGKGRLLPELLSRVPSDFKGYFEPFAGGAALFFALLPPYGYIADANTELVNAYRVIKHKPGRLIDALAGLDGNQETFDRLKSADRSPTFGEWSDIDRAARFIFLNKTCFNGLYRVNRKGQFNAAYGYRRNPQILDADNIMAVHRSLRVTRLTAAPFDSLIDMVRPGDFVYLDPPYDPLSKTANFTTYTKGGFGDRDQRAVWQLCVKLHRKGALWMLSNSATPRIRTLFRAFHTDLIDVPRSLSGAVKGRGPVQEVIVRNY